MFSQRKPDIKDFKSTCSIPEEQTESKVDDIIKFGSTVTKSGGVTIECLTIIGQVEGHYELGQGQKSTKYEHIIPRLVYVEEDDDVDGLLLILNTIGGDVEAGLAIAELISSMKKPTVSLVLGGGHSIGIPLAASAKKSFIVPSATMTIHPVRLNGLVIGVSQSFTYFQKMQDRITDFVCKNTQISEEGFKRLLYSNDDMANDIGSIIDGTEAVNLGLIDEIGGLSSALAALKAQIKK